VFKYFLNISRKLNGAVYISSSSGMMLPEGVQLDPSSTFTLKPGQLAIVATYSSVQIQAISDQLVISWDVLPRAELFGIMQRYMDGQEVRYSLEEMLYNLRYAGLYNDQRWFAPVNDAVKRCVEAVQHTLAPFAPAEIVSGSCDNCGRQFFYTHAIAQFAIDTIVSGVEFGKITSIPSIS
jgi:hypothetical protein